MGIREGGGVEVSGLADVLIPLARETGIDLVLRFDPDVLLRIGGAPENTVSASLVCHLRNLDELTDAVRPDLEDMIPGIQVARSRRRVRPRRGRLGSRRSASGKADGQEDEGEETADPSVKIHVSSF
jgi:hypothetical protein